MVLFVLLDLVVNNLNFVLLNVVGEFVFVLNVIGGYFCYGDCFCDLFNVIFQFELNSNSIYYFDVFGVKYE